MKKRNIFISLALLFSLSSCDFTFVGTTTGSNSPVSSTSSPSSTSSSPSSTSPISTSPISPTSTGGKDSTTPTTPITSDYVLSLSAATIKVGATAQLNVTPTASSLKYNIVSGSECISISGNTITAKREGEAKINATISGKNTNEVTLTISGFTSDPYASISEEEFYSNYYTATSYQDAQYRTSHNLMSGSIDDQNQEPTISSSRPKSGTKYIKNSTTYYTSDKNGYSIVDYQGNVLRTVYKGGAYVTLEDVAAYVYAFGNVPANYNENKSTRPSSSPWGKWLRVNNTAFSGDTSRYPYEPVLPDISGCGGELQYYEIDIGTLGTDCDPNYTAKIYNDGSSITRGAARIVYSRYDGNGNEITDFSKRHVFYTYNHYNDFQEYLNYYGGWGDMFGNVTGGGTLSSKTDYNPTPYVEVAYQKLY